jgi:hypothetical protein
MSCADVQTIQAGDGSKTQFSFDFPYLFKTEIEVSFWNATTKEWDVKATTDATYPWRVTDANPTIVEFTSTAPPLPATPVDPNETSVDNVRIRRTTSIDDIRALFNPGSAIRSDDLNKNFEQLRYAIQEANCQGVTDEVYQYLLDNYWDRFDNTLYSADTWRSDDATIATTAALDQRFQDEVNDTLTKAELAAASDVMPDNDVAVPTTGATKDYIDHVIETDILVDGTGLNKSGSGGQVTIGISAGSVDLDRIKPEDIITSAESNPNNDTTIATTAKIDDMIDAAITGDIAVDSTGLTVTDDGDGTITLGIAAGSVDLDRIKDSDIITRAEQDAGTAEADNNIFTALAAAKRFDTLVQTSNPGLEGNWEVGKTWLQNDSNRALSIWNGSSWLTVSEGGGFVSQPNVVYVDKAAGDDAATGNRISTPKETIKAAIEQINGNIEIDVTAAGFDGGSGYVDGNYSNVSLTHSSGTGIGTGLQATITVSGGAVTAITLSAGQQTTLEEYSIGDVLTANNADLGGTGSGLLIPITGEGDGQIVVVAAGVYQEIAPIQIKRRNVSIIGQALRSCIVHPTPATETNNLFELNSGSYLSSMTFTGIKAGTGTGNTLDATLPTTQGWNAAFYSGAFITKSPYIQNCTNFSDSEIDNSDLRAHRPRGGAAGDTDSAPTGGGLLVNGATPATSSPLRSMVCDSYTHVALNGPGILVVNNGYAQCTSSYAFFNKYHIKALNGGQANLAASTTDFGDQALVADGRSTTAIFTSNVDGAVTRNVDNDPPIISFNINQPTADASWFGSATRPQSNMLVEVTHPTEGTVTYPVLSATANTDSEGGDGWTVTISRPNTNNRSINDGLEDDLADDAAVSFFLRSQIASSGHTMEYVGSGTNYSALPENGGVPVDANQIVESNNGKVWTAITDHNGKFSVGDFFTADQRTGFVSFSAGSVAFDVVTDPTPQLGGDLDVNGNEITSTSNGNVVINPNGTGDIVLDANVGIGSASPQETLHITSAVPTIRLEDADVSGLYHNIKSHANAGLTFDVDPGNVASSSFFRINIDGSEKVRIDSDGRLLIGTATSVGPDNFLQLVGDVNDEATITCWRSSDNTGSGGINFIKTRGSVATPSEASNDDSLGIIRWYAHDGSTWDGRAAQIEAKVDGAVSSGDTPGRLVFSTTADGASSPTTRMTIKNDGKVGIGDTGPDFELDVNGDVGIREDSNLVFHDGSGTAAFRIRGTSGNILVFERASGNEEQMRIDDGKLLVGTSTWTDDDSFVLAKSPSALTASMFIGRFDATITQGNGVGQITFGGTTDETIGATIAAIADADWTHDTSHPTRLVFSTAPDGDTAPDPRMTIKNDGKVGINKTDPGETLDVVGKIRSDSASDSRFLLRVDSTNKGGFSATTDPGVTIYGASTTNPIRFQVSGSEKAQIDTSGRLLVGTQTEDGGATARYSKVQISGRSSGPTGGYVTLNRGSAPTVVNQSLGGAYFTDGTSEYALIYAATDGTPAADSAPGKLIFATTTSGLASPTARMTITSNGNIAHTAIADNLYGFATVNDTNTNTGYGILIRCGKDDATGTNYAVGISDGDGTAQGYITFSEGTVTYGAFTAHHPCVLPQEDNETGYPYGTLVETVAIEYTEKDGVATERGIRYKVRKTQTANSKAVLGAYGSSMNGGPGGETNLHQALVLGDGHILCNNSGGNIKMGDGICSSAVAGIGQKATATPSMIIGIAQEDVTFDGDEQKLVAVQYGLQQFIPWQD